MLSMPSANWIMAQLINTEHRQERKKSLKYNLSTIERNYASEKNGTARGCCDVKPTPKSTNRIFSHQK